MTSISWSNSTSSLGWFTRPQDKSVMCNNPSTPPRSMKTPKSVIFLTTPRRTWPFSSVRRMSSRLLSNSFSMITRRDTTMFLRSWLTFTIFNWSVSPTKASKSRMGFTSTCEPGKKASTPFKSTTKPPLIRRIILPSMISSFSYLSIRRSQARRK